MTPALMSFKELFCWIQVNSILQDHGENYEIDILKLHDIPGSLQ